MKAQLIQEQISEGVIAHVHGFTFPIRRIYFPEDDLAVTCYNDEMYVIPMNSRNHKVISEIDVPEELYKRAKEYRASQEALEEFFVEGSELAEIIEVPYQPWSPSEQIYAPGSDKEELSDILEAARKSQSS